MFDVLGLASAAYQHLKHRDADKEAAAPRPAGGSHAEQEEALDPDRAAGGSGRAAAKGTRLEGLGLDIAAEKVGNTVAPAAANAKAKADLQAALLPGQRGENNKALYNYLARCRAWLTEYRSRPVGQRQDLLRKRPVFHPPHGTWKAMQNTDIFKYCNVAGARRGALYAHMVMQPDDSKQPGSPPHVHEDPKRHDEYAGRFKTGL